MSNKAVARVFKDMADRLQGVVTDTSMLNITPDFSAHLLELYIKKTEGAKCTADRISFFMSSLPRMVHDFIAPDV